jgi:homocysteine S-methyltransferase
MTDDPIRTFLDHQAVMILDGGLATALEDLGFDMNDELWSARILLDDPDLLRQVHLAYLEAGADCIATASYQATIPGFTRRGLTRSEATDLLRFSVSLAQGVRDAFWDDASRREGRMKPLVQASIGPYGAYLADGSEYTPHYDLGEAGLREFHRPRWDALVEEEPDLLGWETIPSASEADALLRLLDDTPHLYAWISFSCRDDAHLADGTPLDGVIASATSVKRVAAVGFNCVPPSLVPDLIDRFTSVTDVPLIVYPNSGEGWDAGAKEWTGAQEPLDFGEAAPEWHKMGASVIGGCCRTEPSDIKAIRDALLPSPERGSRDG